MDDSLAPEEHVVEVLGRLDGAVEKERLVADLPYTPHLVREIITDLEGRGLVEQRPVPGGWLVEGSARSDGGRDGE